MVCRSRVKHKSQYYKVLQMNALYYIEEYGFASRPKLDSPFSA